MPTTSSPYCPPRSSADLKALLNLPPAATRVDIRSAYKRALLRYHPDRHPPGLARARAEQIFTQLTPLYQSLLPPCSSSLASSPSPPKRRVHVRLPLSCFLQSSVVPLPPIDSRSLQLHIRRGMHPEDVVSTSLSDVNAHLHLQQAPPTHVRVSGSDLYLTTPSTDLHSSQAPTQICTPDGEWVTLHGGHGVVLLPGRGLPLREAPSRRGDLVISLVDRAAADDAAVRVARPWGTRRNSAFNLNGALSAPSASVAQPSAHPHHNLPSHGRRSFGQLLRRMVYA